MKNYNPFKMWGSWIGVVFYVLLLIVSSSQVANYFSDDEWRDCAIILADQNPSIDSGDIDYSSCGEKDEDVSDFLFSIQHNWIKKGEMFAGFFAIIFFNLIYLSTFFIIGWRIHSLIRRLNK